MVGFINTIFGYSLFAFFIYLGFYYPWAVLLGTIIAVLFNYKTIGTIVFGVSGKDKLVPFIFVYVVVYLMNVLGLWCTEIYGVDNKYIAGAILLLPLAMVSFVLNMKFVFCPR